MVTERRHYNGRAMSYQAYFSLSRVISCSFSVLCVYSKFRHHSHPVGYLCAKFCFCHGLHCWASPRSYNGLTTHVKSHARWWDPSQWRLSHEPTEKNRVLNHSITHPAYLMCQELKLSLWNKLCKMPCNCWNGLT